MTGEMNWQEERELNEDGSHRVQSGQRGGAWERRPGRWESANYTTNCELRTARGDGADGQMGA